jgi:hypothetical protein
MQILLESQVCWDFLKAHEREHGLGSSTTKCSPGKFRRVSGQMLGRFEEELEIWTPAGNVSGTSNQQVWMTKSSWERVQGNRTLAA